MRTRRLYRFTLLTLAIDVVIGSHLLLIKNHVSANFLFKAFLILQAVVWCLLYYGIYFRIDTIEKGAILTADKYVRRIAFLFFILAPFSLKQIIDEATNNNNVIDLLDYPTLVIAALFALHKYYPEKRLTRTINRTTFNLMPTLTKWSSKNTGKS